MAVRKEKDRSGVQVGGWANRANQPANEAASSRRSRPGVRHVSQAAPRPSQKKTCFFLQKIFMSKASNLTASPAVRVISSLPLHLSLFAVCLHCPLPALPTSTAPPHPTLPPTPAAAELRLMWQHLPQRSLQGLPLCGRGRRLPGGPAAVRGHLPLNLCGREELVGAGGEGVSSRVCSSSCPSPAQCPTAWPAPATLLALLPGLLRGRAGTGGGRAHKTRSSHPPRHLHHHPIAQLAKTGRGPHHAWPTHPPSTPAACLTTLLSPLHPPPFPLPSLQR